MRSRFFPGNQRGVALLMALLAVSFLVTMTMQLTVDVDGQIEDASGAKQVVQLDSIILSGLSVVQAALYSDQNLNTYDSYHDSWGTLDQEQLNTLAGDGELSITVEDLSGKLQVHALLENRQGNIDRSKNPDELAPEEQQEQVERLVEVWKRLLLSGEFAIEDEQQVDELLDAIRDWLDEDDETRVNGAENAYYQSADPPYNCANGRFQVKEELLYVKGMTSELFYGDGEHEGLGQYITVVGDDGKINLNTASEQVLLALNPELSEEIVADLIEYRSDEENAEALATTQWYKNVDGFPGDITLDELLLVVQTSAFQVTVRGQLDRMKRVGRGVLTRHESKAQTLQHWHIQ